MLYSLMKNSWDGCQHVFAPVPPKSQNYGNDPATATSVAAPRGHPRPRHARPRLHHADKKALGSNHRVSPSVSHPRRRASPPPFGIGRSARARHRGSLRGSAGLPPDPFACHHPRRAPGHLSAWRVGSTEHYAGSEHAGDASDTWNTPPVTGLAGCTTSSQKCLRWNAISAGSKYRSG